MDNLLLPVENLARGIPCPNFPLASGLSEHGVRGNDGAPTNMKDTLPRNYNGTCAQPYIVGELKALEFGILHWDIRVRSADGHVMEDSTPIAEAAVRVDNHTMRSVIQAKVVANADAWWDVNPEEHGYLSSQPLVPASHQSLYQLRPTRR